MKYSPAILLLLFGFAGCDNPSSTNLRYDDDPPVARVSGDDEEMNEAKQKAVETLEKFNTALENNKNDAVIFSLKVAFPAPDGDEHIWLSGITFEDGDYYGFVNNNPQVTDKVKLGDFIKIDREKISDWMYLDNGDVYGGYTLRLFRDRMSEEERKEFDATTGFVFMD